MLLSRETQDRTGRVVLWILPPEAYHVIYVNQSCRLRPRGLRAWGLMYGNQTLAPGRVYKVSRESLP